MEFRLLGPLEVVADGGLVPIQVTKHRTLLAALLLRPGQPVTLNELAEAVWADAQPASTRRTIQIYITRLRQVLGDADLIRTGPGSYTAAVEPAQVDLGRFEALLGEARAAADRGDLPAEAATLRRALALWRGRPLADVKSEALHRDIVPGLVELRLQALERRVDVELRLGQHADLVPELRALTRQNPLRERFWAQLMTALSRCGRQADALDAYRTVARRLRDDLGIDPGPELRELHRAVLTSAPSLAAAPSPGPAAVVPRQLPAAVRAFTGRHAALAQLDTTLAAHRAGHRDGTGPEPVVITAIAGTAGVGKTALAVHWARRVADTFPDGQLWLNLRGYGPGRPMTPEQALTVLLRALGIPGSQVPVELDAMAGLYRSLLADRRVLVVLDNAAGPEQVRPLLPGAAGCLVLVTSRDDLSGLVARDGATRVRLDRLDEDEAVALLHALLGSDRASADPDAVHELATLCARLPLALRIVADRVDADKPLREAVAQLAGEPRLDAVTADNDPYAAARTVFSWSYRALSPAAATLFRLLGLHPGADFAAPAAASLAGIPVPRVQPLLAELCRAHLLTEPTPGRFTSHDLLRAYAIELTHAQDATADRRAALHRMLDHYLHTAHAAALLLNPHRYPITLDPPTAGVALAPPTAHEQALDWFTADHHGLTAAVDLAATERFDAHAWRLAWTLVEFLERRGHWQDWMTSQLAALDATHRLGDRAEQARVHRNLARVYIRLHRHDDAQNHLQQALHLSEQVGDRTGQAHALLIRGYVFERQGRYADALDQAQRALQLSRDAGDRTGEVTSLNSVGWCQALLGRAEQAVASCEQALALSREMGSRLAESAAQDSLGYALHRLGDHRRAAKAYREAIKQRRELADRRGCASTLVRLGDTHAAAGDRDAAYAAWQQAFDIYTELGHPDADQVRAKLAQAFSNGRATTG